MKRIIDLSQDIIKEVNQDTFQTNTCDEIHIKIDQLKELLELDGPFVLATPRNGLIGTFFGFPVYIR